VLLVAAVALVVYALHGTHGALDRDLGVFVYGGEHVARGTPPYVGIFNSVGPLADAVPGLAIWLGGHLGMAPVPAARWAFVLLAAGCVVLVHLVARDALGSREAGYVAAGVFLTFTRFTELASDGPREKTTMVLALLGCLLLLGRHRFLGAGVCAALATLAWQPALAPAFAAAAVAVLLARRGTRGDAVVAFLAGGAIPSALTVAWFALTGSLSTAVDGFVMVNLLDTQQPSPVGDPIGTTWLLWHAYGPSLLLVPVGLAGLVLLAVGERRLRTCAAGAVAATAWSLTVLNGSPDLFVVLPFAAIGTAGVVLAGVRRLAPAREHTVLVAVAGAAVVVAAATSVATRSHALDQQQADVAAVLATRPARARVLSIETPQVLALAGRDNPTPYQLFTPTMERYLDHTLPGGVRSYAHQVASLRPTFVTVGAGYHRSWPDRMLARAYWRVGDGPGWTWYLDRDAGLRALHAARRANAAVMGPPARP